MRPELHDIERIDQYLDGSMPASEKSLFEKELLVNPALKEAVETQALMVTAISRKALLAQVHQYAPPRTPVSGSSSILAKMKWPIILSSIVIGALITWVSTRGDDNEEKTEETALVATVPESDTVTKNDTFVAEMDTVLASDFEEMANTDSQTSTGIGNAVEFGNGNARQTVVTPSKAKRIGGLETWVSPEIQRIIINPKNDELVECRDGSVIFIPKNAFVDSKGNLISEPVTLEIIEALTFDKMVMYNLATMNGKNALQSEGMLYVQPKRGKENLEFADGKAMHIEIPTANYNGDMLAWKGVPTDDGTLNWIEPKAIENYLTTVPMSTLDFVPNGFRDEVQATLPFRNYTSSSKSLEDSLYYALASFGTTDIKETWKSIVIGADNNIVSVEDEVPVESINPIVGGKNGAKYNLPVKFDNLPKNQTFNVQVTQGKSTSSSEIANNQATINYSALAPATIRVYSDQCEVVFTDINLARDMALTLDCKNIDCSDTMTSEASASSEPVIWEKCYLNPSSVQAIYDEKFANTFIATPQFQERLQALHQIPNGQSYFDLYVNQLDRNLHEIDRQIAQQLRGSQQKIFLDFANQQLTNVRKNGQDFELLKKYYAQQQKKMHDAAEKRQNAYAEKNAEELKALQKEFNDLQEYYANKKANVNKEFDKMANAPGKFRKDTRATLVAPVTLSSNSIASQFAENNLRPVVGQQQSYKVSWNAPGWMNIDAYLHELSKGQKILPVLAENSGTSAKIYQSINSLKTLVRLNNTENGYEAHFPKNPDSDIYNSSLCLSIDRSDINRFLLAATAFNPYTTSTITIKKGKEYTESELKAILEQLHPGGAHLTAQLEREAALIQEELERKQRAAALAKLRKERMDALDSERIEAQKDLEAKKKVIMKRQENERDFMQNLENSINPCHVNYSSGTKPRQPKVVTNSNGAL